MINNNGFEKALQGRVKCASISKGQFSEEYVVTLNTKRGVLTAIFPSPYIDVGDGTVSVFVVAEEGDLFLVDLPTHTFTTGSKVWLSKNAVSLKGSTV